MGKIPLLVILIAILQLMGCTSGNPRLGGSEESTVLELRGDTNVSGVEVHSSFSENVKVSPAPFVGLAGIAVGIVQPEYRDIPPLERPQNIEVRIRDDELFDPYLFVLNAKDEEVTFLLMASLDLRQTSFELDGKSSVLHEVVVPADTLIEFPFAMIIKEQGLHELQFLAVMDPYRAYSEEAVKRAQIIDLDYQSLGLKYSSRRMHVIVGDSEIPARYLEATVSGNVPNLGIRPGLYPYFLETEDGLPVRPVEELIVLDSELGSKLTFSIMTSQPDLQPPSTHAVSLFVDYLQVPIADRDPYLVYMRGGQDHLVDASIEPPENYGNHIVFAFVTYDPYERWKRGSHRLRVEETYPAFIIRVK